MLRSLMRGAPNVVLIRSATTTTAAAQVYIPKPSREPAVMPATFKEHPERDLANYPHPVVQLWPPKTRLGFIPDKFFQFFYDKTGVTGPYVFGAGLVTFLLQKEIWVMEHDFRHLPPIIIILWAAQKFVGPKIAAYADKQVDNQLDEVYKMKDEDIKTCSDAVNKEAHLQDCYQAIIPFLFEARKESLYLQMEAAYRQRLLDVHNEVKRRVNYLAEVEEVKKKFQQTYLVQWVVDQVRKSISAQQEKAALQQCLSDLKSLAVKY